MPKVRDARLAMTRTERLLELLQILRRNKAAVSGDQLAEELGISLRTVYRDVATLKRQGAPIEGEAGVGFLLRPGFTLPPLMFTIEELEALLLGSRWVDATADRTLAWAARNAMAKIGSVLPREVKREFNESNLWIGERRAEAQNDVVLQTIRNSVRNGWKVTIAYRDEADRTSQRTIWPFLVGFMESCQIVVAWCELRSDYRRFRVDRIVQTQGDKTPYPRARDELLKEWQNQSRIYPSHIEF